MKHKNRLSVGLITSLMLLLLGACDNRQEKAQAAYAEYQAALVSGDIRAARRALAAVVAADDTNADYWMELGRLNIQLSDFSAAYDAFQRAHELDRGNVEVLAIMTQMALRAGNLPIAEENAKQLELLAPDNPAVSMTLGYAALRRADLDEAQRQAEILSRVAPYDPSGKILQARILVVRERPEDAITLLRSQITQQPSDALSLRALASLYELKEDWPAAADALRSYLTWQAEDRSARVRLVEFELRAKRIDAAISATMEGLEKDDIDQLLAPWSALGNQDQIGGRLFEWAQSAHPGRRIAVARFLLTTADPGRAAALVQREAILPVEPANVVPNAIYGAALVKMGRRPEGLGRLDAVLEVDGTVREALSARAQARSQARNHKGAIEDAQKLLASDNSSPATRLLVARIQSAAGDQTSARQTLWQAFHDIEADRTIYDALRAMVAQSDGPQAVQRLTEEYDDQRKDQMIRSFS